MVQPNAVPVAAVSQGARVVVVIRGKIQNVERVDKGWRYEIIRPAPDEFSYPTVFPVFSRVEVKDGVTHEARCELTSFPRRVQVRGKGEVTFRDLRLFEVATD